MGWIDDRIYCHPKVLMVSKAARWTYVAGIAYSSGWGTRGVLERSALEAIGCEAKHRNELVKAGLWISVEGVVWINDWDEHNQKRDERRIADRERKRRLRHPDLSAGQNADSPVERPVERPQDGSALKEVKVVKSEEGTSLASSLKTPPHLARSPDPTPTNGDIAPLGSIFEQVLAAGQIPAPHTNREVES